MMAHYPDVFIMTFSIHLLNFALLSQSAQLLLNFCYATALLIVGIGRKSYDFQKIHTLKSTLQQALPEKAARMHW